MPVNMTFGWTVRPTTSVSITMLIHAKDRTGDGWVPLRIINLKGVVDIDMYSSSPIIPKGRKTMVVGTNYET